MEKVTLEMGSGGRSMRDFIERHIVKTFDTPFLQPLTDAALLPRNIAFTTDSYVVDPLFFPGGDIGTLSVYGTVNDLVVSGAEPKFISFSLILEEGMPFKDLTTILKSVKKAARRAGVDIVTGDTKVVRRGQADKVYINSAGVGRVITSPSLQKIRPGDSIMVTGPLGDHSLAVMLARGDFGLEARIQSDCAPLNFLLPLWTKGVRWMRDITRGGLATVLAELADSLTYPLLIEEEKIPLSRAVRGATELLGIDPLYLACEGRAVLVVPRRRTGIILEEIRAHRLGRRAAVIGRVDQERGKPGELLMATLSGGMRLLEPLTSELLPRIC